MAHQNHPSLAHLSEQRRVSSYKANTAEASQHDPKPSVYALNEAEMVDKGIKYWEEHKNFDHPSVEWWQLKSAKNFETGIGQTMFRSGTLSTWTDAEVQALQAEMDKTLATVGKSAHVKVATVTTNPILRAGEITAVPNDILLEEQKNSENNKTLHEQKSTRVSSIVDLDEYIAQKAEEERKNTKKESEDTSAFRALIQEQQKKQSKPEKNDEKEENNETGHKYTDSIQSKRSMHQRTRTEALRFKLEDMSKKLEQVQNDLSEERDETQRKLDEIQMLETESARNRRRAGNNEKLKQEILQLQGALSSAQTELLAAEEQLLEKDQEITNLKKELQLTKELNQTLSSKVSSGTPLTADDILNQRIEDANRFAVMVAAMQEQLEFERNQFIYHIHQLELQVERKDAQISTLYELYNNLMEPKKGWFERLRESVTG